MRVYSLLDSCKQQDHFGVSCLQRLPTLWKLWRCTSQSAVFVLRLLQSNSRQLSQGSSHSLPSLSLCLLCCGLPGTRATWCHVSTACQFTRKQTDPRKEMLPTKSASWTILPSEALLSDLTHRKQQEQSSSGKEEEQDQPFWQKPWLDWIRCDTTLATVQLSPSAERPAATTWEYEVIQCEVIQEAKAVLSPGIPHHY